MGKSELADIYLRGLNKPRSRKKAIKLLNKSDIATDGESAAMLGFCYEHGIGVEQNILEAKKLYESAIRNKNCNAAVYLGLCHIRKKFESSNEKYALHLFEYAAKNSNKHGKFYTGLCHYFAIGTEKDTDKALIFIHSAIRSGHIAAKQFLSALEEQGSMIENLDVFLEGTWINPVNFLSPSTSKNEEGYYKTYPKFVEHEKRKSSHRSLGFTNYLWSYLNEYRQAIIERAIRQNQHPLSNLSRTFDFLTSIAPEENNTYIDRIGKSITHTYFQSQIFMYVSFFIDCLFDDVGLLKESTLRCFIDPQLDLLEQQEYLAYLNDYAKKNRVKIQTDIIQSCLLLMSQIFLTTGNITEKSPYFIHYAGIDLNIDIENQQLFQESFKFITELSLTLSDFRQYRSNNDMEIRLYLNKFNNVLKSIEKIKNEIPYSEQYYRQFLKERIIQNFSFIKKITFGTRAELSSLVETKLKDLFTLICHDPKLTGLQKNQLNGFLKSLNILLKNNKICDYHSKQKLVDDLENGLFQFENVTIRLVSKDEVEIEPIFLLSIKFNDNFSPYNDVPKTWLNSLVNILNSSQSKCILGHDSCALEGFTINLKFLNSIDRSNTIILFKKSLNKKTLMVLDNSDRIIKTEANNQFKIIKHVTPEMNEALNKISLENDRITNAILGKGAHGKVQLCFWENKNQYVCVKKIIVSDEKNYDEITISNDLKRKTNLINFIDYQIAYNSNGSITIYLFQEFLGFGSGSQLSKALQKVSDIRTRLSLLTPIARDLLNGLRRMHEKKITHLDMKPDNFMLNQDAKAHIIDFGCAQIGWDAYKEHGDNRYFSPERLDTHRTAHEIPGYTRDTYDCMKADSWATGIALLEILFGKYPFPKQSPHTYYTNEFFSNYFNQLELWSQFSNHPLIQLMKKLLTLDENLRWSPAEALDNIPLFSDENFINTVRMQLLQVLKCSQSYQPTLFQDNANLMNKIQPACKSINYTTIVSTSWYTCSQLTILLKSLCNTHQHVDFITPTNLHWREGNTLIDYLYEYHLQEDTQTERHGKECEYLLVPINLNNNHWVGLLIHFLSDNRYKPTISYFDSLNNPIPTQLFSLLKQVYYNIEINELIDISIPQQNNGDDCGPWLIANFTSLIHSNTLAPTDLNVAELRKEHAKNFSASLELNNTQSENRVNKLRLTLGQLNSIFQPIDNNQNRYSQPSKEKTSLLK